MLQAMSTKSQKIAEKSKLLLEFWIRLHYKDCNQKVLLNVDTGSYINCSSLGTFQRLFPNKQLNRSTLLLENYRNSPVSIIGRFTAFIRWKRKVFHKEFHATNANFSANLLSRDACFRMKVLQTCPAVIGEEIHLPPEPVLNETTSVSKIEEMSQPQNHKGKWKMFCIPFIQKVWGSHHLLNRKYRVSMLMFSKDLELSQENPTISN